MKAFILAAGFGTRLLPYTRATPKPLFTLNRQPVLGLLMDRLQRAGFDTIIINTHHGHEQIERYLAGRAQGARVLIRHEHEILGTGGAIRNVADLWGREPMLVFNADVVTDIDPAKIFRWHATHAFPVTLVMHHHERFNAVAVDPQGYVTAFNVKGSAAPPQRSMAFTGIHVLDPRVLDYIPPSGPVHIIDVYQTMLQDGQNIKAWEAIGHYWQDIGTPETYRTTAVDFMVPLAFQSAFGCRPAKPPDCFPLQGDGSDRNWFRLSTGDDRLILGDHGICNNTDQTDEVDSFVAIGRHLEAKGVAVPRIFLYDTFAGLVFMEDLGDVHLQHYIRNLDPREVMAIYRGVIDRWLQMTLAGYEDFDPAWTCQSTSYDRWVILEKECRYFVEAYIQGYLGFSLDYEALADDFNTLADLILASPVVGFMHRDLQSRNIMLKNGQAFFIDFQGGRTGPLAYDLASLLIDPYAALTREVRDQLLDYAAAAYTRRTGRSGEKLIRGYDGCAISRNLQILGAFAYLGKKKGKDHFITYIPRAIRTLHQGLVSSSLPPMPGLTAAVETIANKMGTP